MINIVNYISERLVINKDKNRTKNINLDVQDSSYEGKIQLNDNIKLEFHKFYNSKYTPICWAETWVEGIKDTYVTLIVDLDTYDDLLEYTNGYDKNWGFAILDNNCELYSKIKGLFSNVDKYILIADYDTWSKSRFELVNNKNDKTLKEWLKRYCEQIEHTLINII